MSFFALSISLLFSDLDAERGVGVREMEEGEEGEEGFNYLA